MCGGVRGGEHVQIKKGWREERREMIYSKSSAGIRLPLLFVSPPSLFLSALFITLWEIAEWALPRVFAVIDSKCKLSL